MNNRFTRLISLLLAICMIAGMLEAPLAQFVVNAVDDPSTPSIPEATEEYINNAFETMNDGVIDTMGLALLPRDTANIAEVRKANSYIYMEKNTQNNPTISRDLSDVVNSQTIVLEVDLGTTNISGAAIKLTGTAAAGAEALTKAFVEINAEGKIFFLGADTGKFAYTTGTYTKVTVAVNSTTNKASLWINGVQAAYNVAIDANAFGMLSAMAIELNGTNTSNANLMVDNLKVYSYADLPATYYDYDFSGNADGITFVEDASNVSEITEGYLYLRRTNVAAAAYLNKSADSNLAVKELPEQFVLSFDISSTAYSDFGLYLVDENGNQVNVAAYNSANSQIRSYYYANATTKTAKRFDVASDDTVLSLTFAFNMAEGKYSVWGGSTSYTNLILLAGDTFGDVQYVMFGSKGTESDTKHVKIDNLKLYEGTEPRTGSVESMDPTVIPTAVDTYVDNGFDTIDLSELELFANDTANKVQVSAANHYVFLKRNTIGTTTDAQIYKAFNVDSDYVVVSADIASTSFVDARFYLSNQLTARFKDNKVYWGSSGVSANGSQIRVAADGTFVNVTIVLDSANDNYYFWLDGELVQSGTWSHGKLTAFKISVNGASPESLMVDNIKIYSYATAAQETEPPTTVPPTEPATTAPVADVDVYYNNDFNTDAKDITFANTFSSPYAIQYSERKVDTNGNGYIYLRTHNNNDPAAFWNKVASPLTLPNQFVVSFDHTAMSNWANWSLYLVDTDGNKIQVLWNNNNGYLKTLYVKADGTNGFTDNRMPVSSSEGMNWRNVTVAFDLETKTYSFWCGNYAGTGITEQLDLKLRVPSAGFGTVDHILFYSRGDDTTDGSEPKNVMIDNMKIYAGTEPVANVGPQNKFPTQPNPDEPDASEPPASEPPASEPPASEPPASEPGGTEPAGPANVYYNNDFNANSDGISFVPMTGNAGNNSQLVLDTATNQGYLYLKSHNTSDPVITWNKGSDGQAIIPLPNNFVVSFDATADTKWSNFRMYIVDEDGDKLQILWNKANSSMKRFFLAADGTATSLEHGVKVATDEGDEYRNFTLAFDVQNKTYSYWGGNYAGNGIVEDLNMKLPDAAGTFGTPQYIEFHSRADGTDVGNTWLDNLKVYEGTAPATNVGPQNKFPAEPEGPSGSDPVDIYYNNDFSENNDNITIVNRFSSTSAKQYSERKVDANGNGYMYFRSHGNNDAVAFWNKLDDGVGAMELPKQLVVSFDHTAIGAWANWRLNLVDENGKAINVLWNNSNGYLKRLYRNDDDTDGSKEHYQSVSTEDAMTWRNVTVVFDLENMTYSYWADTYTGTDVVTAQNLKLRVPADFGTVQYIAILSRGDDSSTGAAPGNVVIDNMKIYAGTAPAANVGAQNKFPTQVEPDEPEEPEGPVKVWYNNDFNTNADGISFIGSSDGKHVLNGTEGYIYLRRVGDTKVAYWNRGTDGKARAALDDKFMISFDMSSTALSDGTISIVDEKGEMISVIYFHNGHNYVKAYRTYDKEGVWSTGISNVGYNYTDGRVHHVDVAINTETGKFSVWFNGNQALKDLYLNDNDFSFGTPQYIVFSANDTSVGSSDDGVAQYVSLDNLMIYSGNTPKADVGAVTEQPTLPEEVGGFPPVVVDPGKVGTGVYYNNDFSVNADGIYFANNSSSVPVNERKNIQKLQNGAIFLKRVESGQPTAYWNREDSTTGKLPMSDYFVVSFDLATNKLGKAYIKAIGNEGAEASLMLLENGRVRFYRIKDDGSAGFNVMEAKLVDGGEAVRIDLAINTESGTYSAWANGEKLFSNERFVDPEKFGNMQYLKWYIHDSLYEQVEGTDQKTIIPVDLIIDNLQVYDGLEPKDRAAVGAVNVKYLFPKPEGVNPGTGLYYESNLEDKSTAELTLIGGAKITQESNGNHSVEMKLGSWFSWNYLQKWEPSEYVVFEQTVKAVHMGTFLIRVSSDLGNSFYPVKFRESGEITPSHAATAAKLLAGKEVKVSVAINSVDNTYSVWYDGELVLKNSKISSTTFGNLKGFRFDVTAGDLAKTEWRVDNIRIYQGFCPDDYANVKQLTEQPKDESWLEETQGTQSSLLDYATEELAIINAAGAVMVNTNTLYIYQNGKRTQGTKAQVDAILGNIAGKKVIKNDLGLVIVGPNTLELTEEQIESLANYMVFTRPLADTLISTFKSVSNEHPRVILTNDSVAKLRSDYKNNSTIKEWADKLIARADLRIKSKHVEFSDESFTRAFRDNWTMLSLVYLLTGDVKYKNWLWDDIYGATKFTHWKHTDGLANGDASFGIAIAYDWLYNEWTPEQRKIMEEAIYDKILYKQHRAVYNKLSGVGTYYASETNRNAVSNGGPGMAMLAVFDVYPEKIADILEKTYHLLEIMMVEFAPDGANLEGPAYWEYQMHYLVPFLQSTVNTFGTDFNIMDAPGFARTVDFYMDVDGMTGVNNFHDATADQHGVAGSAFGLANLLGRDDLTRAMLAKMDIYNLNDGMWSLLYYNTDIKFDGTVDKELDAYYKGLEFVSMRSSWLNTAGISVSAHSGQNGISHSHLDAGAFVLDIGGQRFASDYGKESYDLAASSNTLYQYYYYRRRAEAHNVYMINPDLEKGEDLGQATKSSDVVSKFVTKSRGAYAIMPLDSAYRTYADSATRGIMLGDDRKSVLIRDEIRGMKKDTNEVWWFLQMENVEVTISDDGKSAILSKGGVDVHLQVATNAQSYEFKILPAKEMVPLAGLPDVDKQTPNPNFSRLAIVFKTGKDVDINVKFAEVGDTRGDTPINNVALANWDIPDGILKADPVLEGVEIGGVRIPDFKKNQTFYNFELPYGTEECPDVKVIGGEGCNIEIKTPKKLPGYLKITVTSKADESLQTNYKIYLTVSGPIRVEVSDTPEAANHAKNLLDGNLSTKWACNGAGWAKFTFPTPQMVDAIWLCAMEMTIRVQPFNIEVSEDGVNFRKVWEGTTTLLPEGSKDQLQEFKIPEGEYKAIRINVTGARYPDGREYSWSSIFEVMFYYQGKPIEIILQTSDPDKGFTENPNDNLIDDDKKPDDNESNNTDATEPDENQPTDEQNNGALTPGMIWLIVGLSVAAAAVAAVIVILVIKKKKAGAKAPEAAEATAEATADGETT